VFGTIACNYILNLSDALGMIILGKSLYVIKMVEVVAVYQRKSNADR
jgi:hypothetical protein